MAAKPAVHQTPCFYLQPDAVVAIAMLPWAACLDTLDEIELKDLKHFEITVSVSQCVRVYCCCKCPVHAVTGCTLLDLVKLCNYTLPYFL